MDKKLNRTIGYKNTTEVVKRKPVDKIYKEVCKDLLPENSAVLLVDRNTLQAKNAPFVMPDPSKVNPKQGLIYDLMQNDKENTNNRIYEPVISLEDRSKRIVGWLKSHPGFKWSWMCAQLNIDKSNFKRIVDSEKPLFKLSVVEDIELLLKLYGY